ncbi:MAG: hypothetical protein R3D01_03520 [Hyphomicrobiales bacterium]
MKTTLPAIAHKDLDFYIYGIPGLGNLLIYHKHGGDHQEAYTSRAT